MISTSGRKCLVIGAAGFIGRKIAEDLSAQGFQVIGADRGGLGLQILDVSKNPPALDQKFDHVIFCASPNYKNSASELEEFRLGASRWLEYLNRVQVPVVFLSTNNVFDGQVSRPEIGAHKNPICLYGKHKAHLEDIVLQSAQNTVVRLTKVTGIGAPPFQKWIESLEAGQTVQVFSNTPICPVSVDLVSRSVCKIVGEKLTGIFHLSSRDEASFADILIAMAKVLSLPWALVEKTLAQPEQYPRLGLSMSLAAEESFERLGFAAPKACDAVESFCRDYRQVSPGQSLETGASL